MKNYNIDNRKVGIPDLLTLVFIHLKLSKHIDWNWIEIFSPLILSFIIGLINGFKK